MSEMIERVGRAIAKDQLWPEGTNATMVARAAIKAMREPTEAMMAAVGSAGEKAGWLSGEAWKAGWRAMIDAALLSQEQRSND